MKKARARLAPLLGTMVLMGLSLVAVPTAHATTEHCPGHEENVKVESEDSPATVKVLDTRTGDLVEVVVTVEGPDMSVAAVDQAVELVDASWCIKASTRTNSGTGPTGSSTSTNKHGKVQDISYVVLYSVTTKSPKPPPQPCDQSTESGGAGVTETLHDLGKAGPTSFLFQWEAYGVPDRFEVYYEGVLIHDTGEVGDNINEGTGSATVVVPAGSATQVMVRVTGPSGTLWDYVVNCPTPS